VRRNKDATGTKAGTKENKESPAIAGAFYTGKLFFTWFLQKYFPGRRYALIADSAFSKNLPGKIFGKASGFPQ